MADHRGAAAQADGDEFFRVAWEHGPEGIIAMHAEKSYRSGRGEW